MPIARLRGGTKQSRNARRGLRDLGASVSRAGITYATGLAIPTGTDRWQLMLTHHLRKLRPGRYTLTLRSRHGGRRILERTPITIT
jgi:hypothetical protein